jgi:tripartite-type tricarboxylate transporter receptor subunit TctC
LLAVGVVNEWNATLYDHLGVDFVRDIAPVASLNRGLGVLVVHPSFPATTVPELLGYAKAHPGKINMAQAELAPRNMSEAK